MSTRDHGSLMRKVALGLIILAVLGTEISYHFTLESRFSAIEEKMHQDSLALQEMQQSLDAMAASKTETLSDLNRQLSTLQSSFEPLGKNSKDQADALDRLRQQLILLQQAQAGQQDAQRKFSDTVAQLEVSAKKAHAEAEITKPAASPASTVNMPVAVPIPPTQAPASTPAAQANPAAPTANVSASDLLSSPGSISQNTSAPSEPRAQPVDPALLAPSAPKAGAAVVLRSPDATPGETSSPLRARPVGASFSTKR